MRLAHGGSGPSSRLGSKINVCRLNNIRQSRHCPPTFIVKAAPDDNPTPPTPSSDSDGEYTDSDTEEGVPLRPRRRRKPKQTDADGLSLDNFNPVSMGRKSREIFDDVWTQLQRIGSPTRSVGLAELESLSLDTPAEFDSPQASSTTVLVVGATGRVGRVLVRKLLLRGYKVKALVREKSTASEVIPRSVELATGDVGDYKSCRKAVEGVDKIIYCAAARSTFTVDLNRVDADGVTNVTKALMDYRNAVTKKATNGMAVAPTSKIAVADFRDEAYHDPWDVTHLGPPAYSPDRPIPRGPRGWRPIDPPPEDTAECYINESDRLVFEGNVYSRGGYAEMGAQLTFPRGGSLVGTEGLVVRLLGDGQQYTLEAVNEDGSMYIVKFMTEKGFSTLRVPFNTFAPVASNGAEAALGPLNPATIKELKFRFDPKLKAMDQVVKTETGMYDQVEADFKLEIDFVKALPGGSETDMILVSCAGTTRPGLDATNRDRIVSAKRRGESNLRNSGLGYTIVRPGPLLEEAGGYKALVFDQRNRIQQNISCADVADVCLKALHDGYARNKTFEVCWEYTPEEGLETYELVAHLPDRANNYLAPALATLEKNT
jgi:uncharacterized protein YbjT (DUF2867 family)